MSPVDMRARLMEGEPCIGPERPGLAPRVPVPHTGRFRGGSLFRSPRNMAVKRGLAAETGSLKGLKVPPSAWDDLSMSNVGNRNWKRFRRRRWKEQT